MKVVKMLIMSMLALLMTLSFAGCKSDESGNESRDNVNGSSNRVSSTAAGSIADDSAGSMPMGSMGIGAGSGEQGGQSR